MEHEVITQENLIAIYNICKKRLTISQDDFLNNPKYEKVRETTLKRYDAVNKFISSIMNTRRFEIFKENVCVEFGNDNFTDDNIYAYFVDRIQELKNIKEDLISKNAVLLLLTEALKDNTAYTFTLSGNTEVWSEVPMGVERTKAFATSADTVSIDVDSDDITIADGVATVNVTATNVSDDEVKVYVIANVWDGNKFIGQTVKVQNVFATAPSQMISASVSGV
mgnify:CR=1 FL=1